MTGEKNRFKTHEKLWNIDDKSLKTPKHDAMVLWLMDEDNLNKLDFPKAIQHNFTKHDTMVWLKKHSDNPNELKKLEEWYDFYNTPQSPTLPKKICRYEYEADHKEELNYIQNLRTELSKSCFGEDISGTKTWEDKAKHIWRISTEVPIKSSPTFIAGYADLVVSKEWHDGLVVTFKKELNDLKDVYKNIISSYRKTSPKCLWDDEMSISTNIHKSYYLIEVKPYIDSFGAVMRQLNSYKTWTNNILCLFTLDTRFDKQFESQGITVLHPPEDVDMAEYAKEMGL